VESKSFVLSALDGALVLQVEEKRSNQCTVWLVSTMEVLLGFLG
jgi:hypothetical protein